MTRKLRYRPNGTVIAVVSVTLVAGPDDAVIQTLEASDNLAGLVGNALRAYVERFTSPEPGRRFRQRKDGRLILHADLEFFPRRDAQLIAAIEAAPADAVAAVIVDMLRNGRRDSMGIGAAQAMAPEELETGHLGLEI